MKKRTIIKLVSAVLAFLLLVSCASQGSGLISSVLPQNENQNTVSIDETTSSVISKDESSSQPSTSSKSEKDETSSQKDNSSVVSNDKTSSNDINSVFISSDEGENNDNSSEVNYLYSVPDFARRNVDSVLNDKDYTEKFKFETEYVYDEQYPEKTILEQSVEAGTPVEKNGTKIKLTVSRGSKYRTLPYLIDKDLSYAKDTLNELFIRYKVEIMVDKYGDPEKVAATDVEAGTVLDISAEPTVILYVYNRIPEP